MSVKAVRVGRLDVPDWKAADRCCWRCGIMWSDDHQRWQAFDAPCRDCRVILNREGFDLTQFRKRAA